MRSLDWQLRTCLAEIYLDMVEEMKNVRLLHLAPAESFQCMHAQLDMSQFGASVLRLHAHVPQTALLLHTCLACSLCASSMVLDALTLRCKK